MPRSLTWLAAGFLAVAAIISAIGVGAYASLAEIIEGREIERLEVMADLKAGRLENWLRERRGDARVIATGPFFVKASEDLLTGRLAAQEQRRVSQWLDVIRETYGYMSIELFDEDGQRRLVSGEVQHGNLRQDHPEVWRRVLAGTEAELVDIHRLPSGGDDIVLSLAIAVRPAADQRQRPMSILLFNIDPGRFLFPTVSAWPGSSRSGEALLVRREGDEVVFINPLRHRVVPPLSMRLPIAGSDLPAAKVLEGAIGRINGRDYRGVPVTAVVRRMSATPWSLVVKIDDAEIYRDARALAGVTVAAVLFVIVGAAVFVVLLWRQQRMADALAITEKDAIFRSVIDNAADAVLIAMPDGKYAYANKETSKLLGYGSAELLAMSVGAITPSADRAGTLIRFGDLKQRGHLRTESVLQHKGGRLIPVDVNAVVLPDARLFVSFRNIEERKALERRLREELDFSEAVLQATGTVIVVLDRRGRIVRFNQAAEAITGFGREELQDQPVWDHLIPPERQADVRRVFENLMHDRIIGFYENEWLCKDGSRRLFSWRNTVLRDAAGEISHVVALGDDITAQRANERRLLQDREQQTVVRGLLEIVLRGGALQEVLRHCLEQVTSVSWLAVLPKGGVFLKDPQDGTLRLAVAYNLEPEQQVSCARLMPGQCLCGRVAATGRLEFATHVDARHALYRSDMLDHGHFAVPLLSSGQVIGVFVLYLPAGVQPDPLKEEFLAAVAGILATFVERKAVEHELEGYRQQLEEKVLVRTAELGANMARTGAILKTMLDGVIQIDAAGTIEEVNAAVLRMFGHAEEELIGRNVTVLIPQQHRLRHEHHLRHYDHARRSRVVGQRLEVEGLRKDGSIFPLELTTNALDDRGKRIYIGVLRDITRQKAADAAREAARTNAERLARTKSEFLANMSHEIRTPLNAILGLAQIGAHQSAGQKSGATFERILGAGQNLLGIINDILDFSKIEAGKLTIERRPFPLAEALRAAVDLVARRAEDKGLALRVESAADLPAWVSGDKLRFEQILANLLSNAVKFTEQGGIRIDVQRDRSGALAIRVADTGIGMSAEQCARLFAPFEQADGSTTRRFGGTGLGLAISRDLARLMGGDIAVESRVGQGSTFILRLPLPEATPGEETPRTAGACGAGPRLTGLRVLAAEDVELNRIVLEDFLAREGAQVCFAVNGREAVDLVETRGAAAFDIVLMDIQMPVMDGYAATGRIRELAPGLPVIGLTAHALAEERAHCIAAGMVAHVTKPIDLDTLVAAILMNVAPGVRPAPPTGGVRPEAAPPAPTAEQAAADDRPFDTAALLARYQGRRDFIGRLLQTVRQSQAETPDKLRAAAGAGDDKAIAFLAHSVKGVAGNIEAGELRRLASEVEQLAKGGAGGAALAPAAERLAERVAALLACIDAGADAVG